MGRDDDVRNLVASLLEAPLKALRAGLDIDPRGAVSDRMLPASELLVGYVAALEACAGFRADMRIDGTAILAFARAHRPTAADRETLASLHAAFHGFLHETLGLSIDASLLRRTFVDHATAYVGAARGPVTIAA